MNVTLSRYILQEDFGIRKRDFLWNEKKYIYIHEEIFNFNKRNL